MPRFEDIKFQRKKVAKLFNSECYICHKNFGKWFNFHHVEYRAGELTYRDFNDGLKYNEYILPIIEKMPDKFFLLCKPCHRLLGYLQNIKSDSRFKRLVELSDKSRFVHNE